MVAFSSNASVGETLKAVSNRLRIGAICTLVLVCSVRMFAGSSNAPTKTSQNRSQADPSFEKWRAELIDDLKKNWLPLAGLFWLKPGDNTFGSASDNAVVFPKGPAHAGTFTLRDNAVTVKLAADDHAVIAGKPVTESALQADVSGKPTVVEMGSLRFHVIQRGNRVGVRLKDLDSDAVKNYKGPVFFPMNTSYRISGTWVPSDGKKTVDVPNVLGDVTPTPVPGVVEFTVNGQKLQLTALGGTPEKGLFFVFNDLTTKSDTYPGGRFLDSDPVKNDKVVIDFNRAYNPPCSVTPFATCPLAPKENRLQVAIPAGEKYDRSHAHH